MAEVGLLPFARIALQVSRAVLPRYRSPFSKRQFTQPQLLAILCLMRYEDWTFREAEVRLGEHRELRQVLGLVSVPDFTTLYRFLQRLDDQTIDSAVGETVRRLRGSLRQKRKRARVAVDATGLAQGAVSTFFVRRMHHHGQKPLPWRHWLKWVVAVDLDQQFVLSQLARRGPWNDCANLPAVVEAASQQTRIGLLLADAEFDSERNHTYIRKRLGAQSVIPAKRGKKTWRVHGVRAEMRRAFPQRTYRRRALIESLFSSVKRKLSARAPGRSLRTQMRQALLLGLSFNLYRLKHRRLSLRMSTEPDSVCLERWPLLFRMDDDRQVHRLSVPDAIENGFAVRTFQRLYNLLCVFDVLVYRAWTQRRGHLLHDWLQCEVIHLAEWHVTDDRIEPLAQSSLD